MAGGTWTSQNEVRAGAYINFVPARKSPMTVGDRGIVAIPMDLPWGVEGQLIEVLAEDFAMGYSKKDIGISVDDDGAKRLRGALSYCYKALVYRMNKGGHRAAGTAGNLTATAKYAGTKGNAINFAVIDNEDLTFTVVTYVDGSVVDSQTVSEIAELSANDWVTFSGDGALEATAGVPLEDGTDGIGSESDNYSEFLSLLSMSKWQVVACMSSESLIKEKIVKYIKSMRDDEGRYVQGVVADYDGADYEGIINSVSGAVINGETYSVLDFVSVTAGLSAGARLNESNTARVINGATKIINEMSSTEIKKALSAGKFLLSTSTSGKIKVEQDINSLHTFHATRDRNFSKNRIIRTLDEIGTTVKETWEDIYMGKVDNGAMGRGLFKSDLAEYGSELMRISAIDEFDANDDIDVRQGQDSDSVLVDWQVKPIDSMEKLYMTVVVMN